MVVKSTNRSVEYVFYRFSAKRINLLGVWALPATDANGSVVHESDISKLIMDETIHKVKFFGRSVEGFDPQPIVPSTFFDGSWKLFELVNGPDGTGHTTSWRHIYKRYDSHLFIISYLHTFKLEDQLEFIENEKEIQDVIEEIWAAKNEKKVT